MQKTFAAVYENGVLRPLVALELVNFEQVEVSMADSNDGVALCFDQDEWEASKRDDVSLAEVRRALSSIKGSLSDEVIASREEQN